MNQRMYEQREMMRRIKMLKNRLNANPNCLILKDGICDVDPWHRAVFEEDLGRCGLFTIIGRIGNYKESFFYDDLLSGKIKAGRFGDDCILA